MHDELIQQETGSVSRPQTLFKPISWQTKIDFINHLVLFNNVMITVLAEKNGGKTSFIRLLDQHLDPQIKLCFISAKVPCEKNTLICNIADALHLKNEDDLPIDLASVVKQVNERKALVLLIIDDAQNLPETLLKEILEEIQLQKESTYFHLCLVSDFSTVASYNALVKENAQYAVHSIELGTLNETEMKTYVLHKLANDNKVYTEEQINQLFKMTGGCLAKINEYLATFPSEVKVITKKTKPIFNRIYWMSYAALLVVGSLFIFLATSNNSNLPKESIIASLSKAYDKITFADKSKKEIALLSEIPNWEEGTRQLVFSTLPKKQVLAMLDEDDLQEENANQAIVDKVVVIPKIDITKTINITEKQEHSVIPSIKQKPYTIQLMASHHLSDIHKFIHQYKLEGKCAIRLATREKDSWYILTVGEFQTNQQANIAAGKLSTTLARFKPWVRSTGKLKLVG